MTLEVITTRYADARDEPGPTGGSGQRRGAPAGDCSLGTTELTQPISESDPVPPDHEVVVIGAGVGGLGAAIALKKAGIEDFVIFERAADIGGTWFANHYPDVAVDVPGIVYQFSFAKNPDWTRTFPKGAEVKAYLDVLADQYGLRDHLRLGVEVMARRWDEDNHLWHLTTGDGDVRTARYVIAALGAFVEPKKPDIAGLDTFAGTVIHSHDWDDGVDLADKRVAIIGTGATAVQLVPQLARAAVSLEVFQRRAIWVFAKPDFTIPKPLRWALRVVPGLQGAIRALVAIAVEIGLVAITVHGRRIAPLALIPRWACQAFLYTQVRDRALRRKLTPNYGFGCKRPSVSNAYYKTFTYEDVHLVTEPISMIGPRGVLTDDGAVHEVDILVLATGFEMSQSPRVFRQRPVTGMNGFDLADFYEHHRAKAYEGVCIPELPNLFMVFGPYAWSGSSWHVMVENAARVALRLITEAQRRGATAVSVTPEANDRFAAFVRDRSTSTLMHGTACAGANSYYLDRHGDFSFLRPTTAYQATRASRTFDLDDFDYRRLPARQASQPTAVSS